LDASGSSNVDLSEYQVSDANLDVSGASSVTVNPGGTLNVIASGASEVFYLGEPTLGKVDSSGSSNVEAR
jgi:DNA/RNA endonuclease YhcR with UshA esterase domain